MVLKEIIWSDEATFRLNDIINRHDYTYGATVNSHVVQEH